MSGVFIVFIMSCVFIVFIMSGVFIVFIMSGVFIMFIMFIVSGVFIMFIMVIILMLFKRNWRNPGCGHNHSPIKRGCFGQPFQPAFEFQSVHEQQICLSHRPCSFWRWLIYMRVALWPNERC